MGITDMNKIKPLWQRMGWLVVIWTCSVLVLGFISWLLRLLMQTAGMDSP